MTTRPTAPIELTGFSSHLRSARVTVSPEFVTELESICEVTSAVNDVAAVAEASRDWWPIALHWALAGEVPSLAAVIAHPHSTEEVSRVLSMCNTHRVPVTAAGGRSGVCGASIPVHGGVVLDTTGLNGLVAVDAVSGVVEVRPGTFGPDLERELQESFGLTVGHHPQSFDLATVGGWVACRGAGQYSTRYGKIEDMVIGLEVVLADGSIVRTGGHAAGAVGPDLDAIFVGSEGTLGIVTSVLLRTHPVAEHIGKSAYRFPTLDAAFEGCRRAIQAGATPAVMRLYDAIESARSHGGDGAQCTLLVLDEGHPLLVAATLEVVDEQFRSAGAEGADESLVDHWLEHRNDTTALQGLTRKGFAVDTMEVTAPWSRLREVYDAVRKAALEVEHVVAASAHLSHSYPDGACLYFSIAARPPKDSSIDLIDATHRDMWDAAQRAALHAGANLSHHHGIGLNRARYMAEAMGSSFDVLELLKASLDPNGILNPGKLGLPDHFGESGW